MKKNNLQDDMIERERERESVYESVLGVLGCVECVKST